MGYTARVYTSPTLVTTPFSRILESRHDSSGSNLVHPSDIVFQKMFVHEVKDLQPADEREYRDVLTVVRDLGQLALKVADVRFEAATLPHLVG